MTTVIYTLGVVIFVLGIIASIALHELGHLLPARYFGVKVTQYFVGCGRSPPTTLKPTVRFCRSSPTMPRSWSRLSSRYWAAPASPSITSSIRSCSCAGAVTATSR